MTLSGAERRRSIRFCSWDERCGREPACGGGGRRTAEPAAAGRKPAPYTALFESDHRGTMLLGCVTNPLPSSSSAKGIEGLAYPADSEIPFFNEHTEIANQHGMDYQEALEFIIRMRHGGRTLAAGL